MLIDLSICLFGEPPGLDSWLERWSLEPDEQTLSSSEEAIFLSSCFSEISFKSVLTFDIKGKALIGESDPSSSIHLASILNEYYFSLTGFGIDFLEKMDPFSGVLTTYCLTFYKDVFLFCTVAELLGLWWVCLSILG